MTQKSKSIYLHIIISLSVFFSIQNGMSTCSVSLHLNNTQNTTAEIRLIRYDHGALVPCDTVITNEKNGIFELRDESGNEASLYLLLCGKHNYIELILTSKEHPQVSLTADGLDPGNPAIQNSLENDAYLICKSIQSKYDSAIQATEKTKLKVDINSFNYYSKLQEIEQQLFRIQAHFNTQLDQLRDKYPQTFTSRAIIPVLYMAVPVPYKYYETNRSFMVEHYFDYLLNCTGENTNHYYFTQLIEDYFIKYFPNNTVIDQSLINRLYEHSKHDPKISNAVFDILIGIFYKNMNETGIEQAYNAWNTASCPNAEQDTGSMNFVKNLLRFKVGNKAENIALPDKNFSMVELNEVIRQHQLTLLLFWRSGCSSCEEQLPRIKDIYNKYKANQVAVYAVSLDDDAENWKKTLAQNGYDWINVIDSKKNTTIQYAVRQTPTLLAIDNSGTILYKNIYGFTLESAIEKSLLSKTNEEQLKKIK